MQIWLTERGGMTVLRIEYIITQQLAYPKMETILSLAPMKQLYQLQI